MKKLLFLFILISQNILAQKSSESKISIGFFHNITYNYRQLNVLDNDFIWLYNYYNDRDIPKFGNSLGISLFIDFNKRLNLETGIYYTNRGFKLRDQDFTQQPYINFMIEKIINYKYKFQFLEIPIKINYVFFDRKFKLYSSLGYSSNFLIFSQTKNSYKNFNEEDFIKVKNTNFADKIRYYPAIKIGIGSEIHIEKLPFTIRIEANYNRLFNYKQSENAIMNTHLYGVGLNVGFVKNINKN